MASKGKRIPVGTSSHSNHLSPMKRYRVKIDGEWYEGTFSKHSFGWQFDDYRPSGMQLNLCDEVYELPSPTRKRGRPRRS